MDLFMKGAFACILASIVIMGCRTGVEPCRLIFEPHECEVINENFMAEIQLSFIDKETGQPLSEVIVSAFVLRNMVTLEGPNNTCCEELMYRERVDGITSSNGVLSFDYTEHINFNRERIATLQIMAQKNNYSPLRLERSIQPGQNVFTLEMLNTLNQS